jgi:hypothetical protein
LIYFVYGRSRSRVGIEERTGESTRA